MTLRITNDNPQFIFDDTTGRRVGVKQPTGAEEFFPLLPSQPEDATAAAALKAAASWYVLAASGVAVPHTGDTDEYTHASVAIPAGAWGPNGLLRVTSLWSWTSSSNNKTVRVSLGATPYAELFGSTALAAGLQDQRVIWNRGSEASQVGSQAAQPFTYTANAPRTTTVNTANAATINFTSVLASAGETITLQAYLVEIAARA